MDLCTVYMMLTVHAPFSLWGSISNPPWWSRSGAALPHACRRIPPHRSAPVRSSSSAIGSTCWSWGEEITGCPQRFCLLAKNRFIYHFTLKLLLAFCLFLLLLFYVCLFGFFAWQFCRRPIGGVKSQMLPDELTCWRRHLLVFACLHFVLEHDVLKWCPRYSGLLLLFPFFLSFFYVIFKCLPQSTYAAFQDFFTGQFEWRFHLPEDGCCL